MKRKFYTTWRVVVACKIRRARIASKMSQAQFAKRMGLSQSAWSRIEQGKAPLAAHRLAEAIIISRVASGPLLLDGGMCGRGIEIPPLMEAIRLNEFGVDVIEKADPKRRPLGYQAVYDLIHPY